MSDENKPTETQDGMPDSAMDAHAQGAEPEQEVTYILLRVPKNPGTGGAEIVDTTKEFEFEGQKYQNSIKHAVPAIRILGKELEIDEVAGAVINALVSGQVKLQVKGANGPGMAFIPAVARVVIEQLASIQQNQSILNGVNQGGGFRGKAH